MKEYTVFVISEGSSEVFKSVNINAENCEFTAATLILTAGGKVVAQFINSKVAGFAQRDKIS